MALLGGLALEAHQGAADAPYDYEVYIKVDGVWELAAFYARALPPFKLLGSGVDFELAVNEQPTYENTGGANVIITDICVGFSGPGALVTELNTLETSTYVEEALVIPIHAVQDSPRTVVPLEIVQFTTIKTAIESP